MHAIFAAIVLATSLLGWNTTGLAATTTRAYDVSATGAYAPFELWEVTVTVTFDPAVDVGYPGTAVDSIVFGGAYASQDRGGYVYDYRTGTHLITVGNRCIQAQLDGSCYFSLSGPGTSFFSLDLTDPDNPIFDAAVFYAEFDPNPQNPGGLDDAVFRPTAGTATLSDGSSNVPEPTTLALLALGLTGLGFSRRRH